MKKRLQTCCWWLLALLSSGGLSAQYVVKECEHINETLYIIEDSLRVAPGGTLVNGGTLHYQGVRSVVNEGGFSEAADLSCGARYSSPCSEAAGSRGLHVFDGGLPQTRLSGSHPLRMYAVSLARNIVLAGEWQIVHDFSWAGSGRVVTDRSRPAEQLHWLAGSSTGAAADRHVDGYAAWSGSGPFHLPLGDGSKLRPAGVVGDCSTRFVAAYFGGDPAAASLPAGAPFSTTALAADLSGVSSLEYWDINGSSATPITLTFDAASNLSASVTDLSQLFVAGWDGSRWVNLGRAASSGSLGGSGSISSPPVVPDQYQAYTFGFQTTGTFALRAFLQGALFGSSDGRMRDPLRSQGRLPASDPYAGLSGRLAQVNGNAGVSMGASVLTPTGDDAIVDWVLVEFRAAANPATIVATRAALLQRDGDVVSPEDGSSPLTFGTVGESYYLAIKHRNHLGVMTAAPVPVQRGGSFDFSTAGDADLYHLPGYDGLEQASMGGLRALWAGDANQDGKLKYQGGDSDLNRKVQQLLTAPGNSAFALNFNDAVGYYSGDLNLDGKVKYSGADADNNWLFMNVVTYLRNTDAAPNFNLLVEQLPGN